MGWGALLAVAAGHCSFQLFHLRHHARLRHRHSRGSVGPSAAAGDALDPRRLGEGEQDEVIS